MEIPSHYPTCEICSILQDRVYSISGNDKRFPPLSRAFSSGYKIIHPNCRHVVVAWIESMHTAQEIEDAIKRSTRSWVDARTGEEVKFYNDLQTKARRARDLRAQYERYKDRLGADAPKSLMAFKKLKNGGGDKWEELQSKYRHSLTQNVKYANSSSEKYMNYAKTSINFISDSEPNEIDISKEQIINEVLSSEVGQQAVDYINQHATEVRLVYNPIHGTERGGEQYGVIYLYMSNIKNPRVAAQTLIHEVTHAQYKIGGSQWAEAVCMAKEKMHIVNRTSLTISEKRYIIKLAKQAYPEFSWRKENTYD